MQLRILALCLALFTTPFVHAQIQSPPASPGVTMETTVGLTDVSLEYSRPGMKGRTLFAADGLVPYGELWRTGANQATKITFSDPVQVAGKEVPAGAYAILTKPSAQSWDVMFYPYSGGAWTNYVEMDPAVTVTAKVSEMPHSAETFTIDIRNYTMDGADLVMMWGNTMATLPIVSNAKESVMATIDRVMAGPSANDYFQAATFLSETGADNEKALEYVRKAISMSDNPAYWIVRREAVILNDLGRKQEAVAAAKKSRDLAEKAGNMDYVRMNDKSIEDWSK
ncbi:DUF2911 domain-containing protein [Neolewinella litorea]|uniref:DUF2911 domain-containing protein n=1 Tax=Neolewinella litorea TaxID=2562452 RepID=A0A4S4NG92_9BACT|nr:DUF2911 domain-containing protein [Neolewinella litorea]THH37667.1 DUF2911 domain-containing protein [Neolewinella litorea]